MKQFVKVLILLFAGFILFYQTAWGQSSIPFGIKPENPRISYFEYTLNPGESVSDVLVATNQNTKPIKVFIAPVDGTTATGGGINLSYDDQAGVSRWINFGSVTTVEVKRQSLEKIPFTVTVPEGTPPGEYVAGFLAQLDNIEEEDEALNTGTGSSFSIKVIPQVGVAVIIHVPGEEKCKAEIESLESTIQTGKLNLQLDLINSGNTAFKSNGKLTVINKETSSVVSEIPLSYGYTIAGTSLKANIIIDLPAKGEYLVKILLQDNKIASCKAEFEKPLTIGEEEITKVSQQATAMIESILQSTSVPVIDQQSQAQPVQQIQQFPVWILWIAAIVFLVGLSLTVYATAILKQRK